MHLREDLLNSSRSSSRVVTLACCVVGSQNPLWREAISLCLLLLLVLLVLACNESPTPTPTPTVTLTPTPTLPPTTYTPTPNIYPTVVARVTPTPKTESSTTLPHSWAKTVEQSMRETFPNVDWECDGKETNNVPGYYALVYCDGVNADDTMQTTMLRYVSDANLDKVHTRVMVRESNSATLGECITTGDGQDCDAHYGTVGEGALWLLELWTLYRELE